MSKSYEEPKSWPVESVGKSTEPDFVFEKLKEEIASARRVLDEHRDKMNSIGKPHLDPSPESEIDESDAPA